MENEAFEAIIEVGLRKQVPRPVQLLPVLCIEHYVLTSKFIGAKACTSKADINPTTGRPVHEPPLLDYSPLKICDEVQKKFKEKASTDRDLAMKTSMLNFDTEVTLLGVYQLWIRTQLGHFETTRNEFHHEPRNKLLVDLKEVLEEHRQRN